jgi:hypothetical protein
MQRAPGAPADEPATANGPRNPLSQSLALGVRGAPIGHYHWPLVARPRLCRAAVTAIVLRLLIRYPASPCQVTIQHALPQRQLCLHSPQPLASHARRFSRSAVGICCRFSISAVAALPLSSEVAAVAVSAIRVVGVIDRQGARSHLGVFLQSPFEPRVYFSRQLSRACLPPEKNGSHAEQVPSPPTARQCAPCCQRDRGSILPAGASGEPAPGLWGPKGALVPVGRTRCSRR